MLFWREVELLLETPKKLGALNLVVSELLGGLGRCPVRALNEGGDERSGHDASAVNQHRGEDELPGVHRLFARDVIAG